MFESLRFDTLGSILIYAQVIEGIQSHWGEFLARAADPDWRAACIVECYTRWPWLQTSESERVRVVRD